MHEATVMGEVLTDGLSDRGSTPLRSTLQHERSNPFSNARIGVLGDIAFVTIDLKELSGYRSVTKDTVSYADIRQWVKQEYGINVSNLAVSQTKDVLGIAKTPYKGRPASGKYQTPNLKPEKQKAITEALKHFGML